MAQNLDFLTFPGDGSVNVQEMHNSMRSGVAGGLEADAVSVPTVGNAIDSELVR